MASTTPHKPYTQLNSSPPRPGVKSASRHAWLNWSSSCSSRPP